jgi:hypothetical protein
MIRSELEIPLFRLRLSCNVSVFGLIEVTCSTPNPRKLKRRTLWERQLDNYLISLLGFKEVMRK